MADFDRGQLRIAFPLWMAVGSDTSVPFEERSGAITCTTIAVSGADKAVALFTRKELVEQFLAAADESGLVPMAVETPAKLLGLLEWLQSRQRTHVVFDPIAPVRMLRAVPIRDVTAALGNHESSEG